MEEGQTCNAPSSRPRKNRRTLDGNADRGAARRERDELVFGPNADRGLSRAAARRMIVYTERARDRMAQFGIAQEEATD